MEIVNDVFCKAKNSIVIFCKDAENYVEYTPYGETWIEKSLTENNVDLPYKFTGKELDEETGLYYYGARYLDPKTSRWLSTDPALGEYIPQAGSDNSELPGMGGIYNQVNFHLYHYAGNNPVKYVDPDGRQTTGFAGPGRFYNPYFVPTVPDNHFPRNAMQEGLAPRSKTTMDNLVKLGLFDSWKNTGTHNLEQDNDSVKGRVEAFFGGNKGSNFDYRGAVGSVFEGAQFIYDGDGNLVVDSVNKGTYDYATPEGLVGSIDHFFEDVIPWFGYGNGPADDPNKMYMTVEQEENINIIYNSYETKQITIEEAQNQINALFD